MATYTRKKNGTDPNERLLAEAEKRRKRFSKKVTTKKSGEMLKNGAAGTYTLKGSSEYGAPKERKKGKRSVVKEKQKRYVIPEAEYRTKDVMRPYEETVPGIAHETGTAGKKTTSVKEKTEEGLKEHLRKDEVTGPSYREKTYEGTTKGLKEKQKAVPENLQEKVGKMEYYKKAEAPGEEVHKGRMASKVAFEKPDYLVKTKHKSVTARGQKLPHKGKTVTKTKSLVSKEYKSKDKPVKYVEPSKDGKDVSVKRKVRGDVTIEKRKWERAKHKKDGFYRQYKPKKRK